MPDDTTLEGVEQFADESREFAEASLPLAAEILPDDTTAPVTAEGLRERIETAAVQWLVSCPFPLLGISGSTPSQALTESSQALAETWGRELTDLVVAALAGDPGDLPARMAEALYGAFLSMTGSSTTNCNTITFEHLARVALSVRWEHAAHLAARVGDAERRAEHAESEHQVTQDRLDRARALVEGQQKTIREEITARGQVEAERDALNACIRATCSAARIAREVGDHRKVVLLSDVERLLTVPELPPLSPPAGGQ